MKLLQGTIPATMETYLRISGLVKRYCCISHSSCLELYSLKCVHGLWEHQQNVSPCSVNVLLCIFCSLLLKT